jgi:FAD/FMN-containing dehydrogenase
VSSVKVAEVSGRCPTHRGNGHRRVLALEAVPADGRVLHAGRRSRNGVAGYDLTSRIVGSEARSR